MIVLCCIMDDPKTDLSVLCCTMDDPKTDLVVLCCTMDDPDSTPPLNCRTYNRILTFERLIGFCCISYNGYWQKGWKKAHFKESNVQTATEQQKGQKFGQSTVQNTIGCSSSIPFNDQGNYPLISQFQRSGYQDNVCCKLSTAQFCASCEWRQ